MKTIKKQFNLFITILSMIFLFQGCTIYKPDAMSFNQVTSTLPFFSLILWLFVICIVLVVNKKGENNNTY